MAGYLETALYVVATPIGNLEDITLRALEVLKNVDIIAAEDTRTTSVLLDKYQIKTKLISCHKFSEASRTELFLEYLQNAKSVALVSDAGTPLISDPGELLVRKVREEGFRVVPVIGACAVIALLSSIERQGEDFKFVGFLPRVKNQIIDLISKNKFTKKFEEIKTDSIENIINYYKTNPLKGEIVAMLYKSDENCEIEIDEKIKKLKQLNFKDKEIASILSTLYDINKNSVYKKCITS